MMVMSHQQVDIWPSTHLLQQPALGLLSTCCHHRNKHNHHIIIVAIISILIMRNLLTVPPPTKVAPQPVIVGEGFDKSAVRFLQFDKQSNFVQPRSKVCFACHTCRDSCQACRLAPPRVGTRLSMQEQVGRCRAPVSSCSTKDAAAPWQCRCPWGGKRSRLTLGECRLTCAPLPPHQCSGPFLPLELCLHWPTPSPVFFQE